jgi:hypothetical protein
MTLCCQREQQLNARIDIVALAQAKAEIRDLVERDFKRKSSHSRKRHARFLENHASSTVTTITVQPTRDGDLNDSKMLTRFTQVIPTPAQPDTFTDDEVLPVFEANLDLPHVPVKENKCAETQQSE